VLVMACGYSRWLSARLLRTRAAEDLFAGWWSLIEALGVVLWVLVWDGEGAVERWRRGVRELTADTQAFCGVLGVRVLICRPADPEARGWSNARTAIWRPGFARAVVHLPGRLQRPAGRVARAGQHPTQAGAGPRPSGSRRTRLGWWRCRRWHRSAVGGARCGCRGTLGGSGRQRLLGAPGRGRTSGRGGRGPGPGLGALRWRVMAEHDRCWARHQTITDLVHLEAANALRLRGLVVLPRSAQPEVEQRALTDYDVAFGLGEGARRWHRPGPGRRRRGMWAQRSRSSPGR
jgi:hypothetical protein